MHYVLDVTPILVHGENMCIMYDEGGVRIIISP